MKGGILMIKPWAASFVSQTKDKPGNATNRKIQKIMSNKGDHLEILLRFDLIIVLSFP